MNVIRLFIALIFFSLNCFSNQIDYQELSPDQLQVVCNALLLSCERIKAEIELQTLKTTIFHDLITINKEENKGKAYKSIIPLLLKHIQQADMADRLYAEVCQNHEFVIDLIMNQDKKVIRVLEILAQRLTEVMQTYSDNSKKDIDQMLSDAKKVLASLEETFKIMKNCTTAIEEGKLPVEIKPAQENSSKVDMIQRFMPVIMQAIKRAGQLISSLQDNISPYHLAGKDLIAQEYQRCYSCLQEKTKDLPEREQYFAMMSQANTPLPAKIV